MIIGQTGLGLVISADTAYLLETFGDIKRLRQRIRGRYPNVSQELLDLRTVAMSYDPERLPEAEVDSAELAAQSEVDWLSPQRVADLLGISDRAVRLACSQGRIDAQQVGSRWRISEEGYRAYRAARAA